MNIQKHFNLKRFYNYFKYDLKLNSTTYIYSFIGLFIVLFSIDFFMLNTANSKVSFLARYYIPGFWLTIIPCTILVIGTCFPSLITSKKTANYLMIPASIFEKLLTEFTIRILTFPLLFFISYWIVFKLSYSIYNLFEWKHNLQLESFEITDVFKRIPTSLDLWAIILSMISIASFLFIGSIYFKKFAIVKTIITFGVLLFFTYTLSVILSHLLLPDEVQGFTFKILDRRINDDLVSTQLYVYITGCISSLFLLPLAYFKLTEKEV